MRSHRDQLKMMALLFTAIGFPVLLQAQRSDESVRVTVHRTQEGHSLEIEEDVPAADAENLEELMKKYGVSEELQQLKPGEEVEIVIRRKQGGEDIQDVTIEMDRKPAVTPTTPTKPATPAPVERKRAFLGVHYEMEWGSTNGSHITKVEPGTPAYKAGLKSGDVITHADGVELRDLDDLSRIISSKKGGDKVKLSYIRDGKPNTTIVTLEDRDENFFRNSLGSGPSYIIEEEYMLPPGSNMPMNHGNVLREEATGPLLGVLMIHTEHRMIVNGVETVNKTEGAIVDDIIANSAATEIGLRKGDKILVINGKHIKASTEVTALVATMKPGDKVDVEYLRDGQRRSGSGTLKARKDFDLPSEDELKNEVDIRSYSDGDADPGMFDRVHKMMEEARLRASGGETVREFRMVITMDELSPAEAQSLSAKSGQQIKAESDLDLRGLSLSPNPSTGKFHMGFELPARGTTFIEVMDMNGEIVYAEQLNDFQGRYAKDFDISHEAKGVYVMRIVQGGKAFTRKIVTQ